MAGREDYVAAIGAKLELHSTFTNLQHKIPNTHIVNHGILNHTALSKFVSSVFVCVRMFVYVCVCVCARARVCVCMCALIC